MAGHELAYLPIHLLAVVLDHLLERAMGGRRILQLLNEPGLVYWWGIRCHLISFAWVYLANSALKLGKKSKTVPLYNLF